MLHFRAPLSLAILAATGLAATSLAAAPALAGEARPAAAAASPRQQMALAEGWRFRFGEAGDAPAQPGFDDSGWEAVAVPHSWNRIGEYGAQRSATTDNRRGIGWYRLAYAAPAIAPRAARGQRHYLDFAAVGSIADVWVNGVHIGQHRGAFSRFRLDVTAVWRPGETNHIAVRADNSKPAPGSSTAQAIPLAGDFFIHGGIYRPVTLVTTSDAGLDLLDHGGPGVYVRTVSASAGAAQIAVTARTRDLAPRRARALSARVTIRDAAGNVIAADRPIAIQPDGTRAGEGPGLAGAGSLTIDIANPRLWNGRADPHLYTATVDVLRGGRVIDSVTQTFGIRTFRFDADAGFFLNGSHLRLQGVSRHQDRAGRGWALTREDHAEDMALIAEMGANTVRHAHYQHADEWSDEADRAGMAVWAEVPYVTTPSLEGGEGSPELWANAEQQLRELIRQNYNHPSIVMWSVGNEVDAAKGFGVAGEPARPLALLRRLNEVARAEDPGRPTTFADCCEDLGMMETAGERLAGTTDLIGYNRYYGWYYPNPAQAASQLATQMDRFHAKHPTLPISISEYGGGGAVSQHSDNVATGFLNFMGRPQPEEFLSYVHEQNWPVIRDRDFIFASWVWNMFDFPSDLREEGDSFDLNTKGLVTFDRRTRKDAFFYYKAQWNPEPMIHLTGKRHAERPYPVMEVKAYSNADRATLSLNGVNLGEAPCPDRICTWTGVALRPGANLATVTAEVRGTTVTDSATWHGPDPAQGIRLDAGDLAGRVVAGRRFGSDTFVTGGTPVVLNMGGFGGRRLMPPRSVTADQPALYDYWREGEAFSYAVPVPDGRWTVTIHTFEPRADASAALRMSVRANGAAALAPFNVTQAAGGALRGIARSFPVTVQGGVLRLDFAGTGGKAVVAAIEIAP